MEEKIIIKKEELNEMVSEYIMMGSEAAGTEIVYSNMILIKEKACFMYCYSLKLGNSYINCNQVLFKTEIINIINYYFKQRGYFIDDYELINDKDFELQMTFNKIKNKQKTMGMK